MNTRITRSMFAFLFAASFVWTASSTAATTWSFKGTVTEVNKERIEVTGVHANGQQSWMKFKITPETMVKNGVLLWDVDEMTRFQVTNEIRRGSTVTVWATPGRHALIIQNMAPKGQGDYFGPIDCPSCGH